MLSYLRVKIRSLAVEATIIRAEEQKLKGYTVRKTRAPVSPAGIGKPNFRKVKTGGTIRWLRAHQKEADADTKLSEYYGLHWHRIRDIRPEARAAQLAYGFLRGTSYHVIEKEGSVKPPFDATLRLAQKYGSPKITKAELEAWFGIEPEVEVPAEAPKKGFINRLLG